MPYVNVQILEGASRAQKEAVVHDITKSLVTHLGKKPEHIHVVLQEIPESNWGYAGLLTDTWKAQQAARAEESPG